MKIFPMNLSFGSPPQIRRLSNRSVELLPYVFNKWGHNAPRLRTRRPGQLEQVVTYGKWTAVPMELGSRSTEAWNRRPEGQEIELFGGAVRQIQTAACNDGASSACLLYQLRKDFLVEMR
jgi:hypothetical protein